MSCNIYLLLMVVAVSLPILTHQQCLTEEDSKKKTDPNARLALVQGQQEFSLSLLNMVHTMSPGDNIFFSPFSIYQTLLLAYFVSANYTEENIKSVMYLPKEQDKLSLMQAYSVDKFVQNARAVNGSSSYQLSHANKLFASTKQKVKDCMEVLFKDEIESLDFTDPVAATEHMNKWVEEITKGQIKDLIPAGILSETTQLVLANAAYFKGLWKSKFLKENFKKDLFYISGSKNKFVTMMRQKGNFNHAISEKLGAHILELPYKGDDVSMYILLPPFAPSPNSIAYLLKRLTLKLFREVIEEDLLIARPVEVALPKFTVEKSLPLTQVFQKLGLKIFDEDADFSSLTGQKGITFNEAIHKAKVQVDEDGTTAAAATAVISFRSSRPLDPVQFICNHPFVYLLYDKQSQTILFEGVYANPEQEPDA